MTVSPGGGLAKMTSSGTAGPRAALLGSGGVLMRPIGGRWNPRADFEETILS